MLAALALGHDVGFGLTFGGAFNRYAGMALWWLVFFAPSLVYAALVFRWDER